MVEVGIVDWSNYVLAGVAAGGASVGAYRWVRGGASKRKRRQAEYENLWQEVYGSPALVDEHGIEYQPAKAGLVQTVTKLAGDFYGHTQHPPHPGRRRTDAP